MPYVFIVVDELDGLKSQESLGQLLRALQRTRFIGFHFLVSTSDIFSNILFNALLANFQLRILLGDNFAQNAKLTDNQVRFLGDDYAYESFPKGTAIISCFSANKPVTLEQIRVFYDEENRPLLANLSSVGNYPDYIVYSQYICLECGYQPIYFSETKCPFSLEYSSQAHNSYVSILTGSIILGAINFFSEIIERHGENSLLEFNDQNFVKRLFAGTKKSQRVNRVFSEKKRLDFVNDVFGKRKKRHSSEPFDDAEEKPKTAYTKVDPKNQTLITGVKAIIEWAISHREFGLGETNENEYCLLRQWFDNSLDWQKRDNFGVDETIKFYCNQYNRSCEFGDMSKFIKRIEVKNLFGYHSYAFDFESKEKLQIIFGTNGLGKTTIFKMLEALLVPGNQYENINKMSYLLEGVKFERFNVSFSDGSGVYVVKDNVKNELIIDYSPRGGLKCFDSLGSLLTIEKSREKEMSHFKEKTMLHFDNIRKLFPKLPKKNNRFLFINVDRVSGVDETLKYIRTEYKYNKNRFKQLINSDYFERTLSQFKTSNFVNQFSSLINEYSIKACNAFDDLFYGLFREGAIHSEKEKILYLNDQMYGYYKRICEVDFCNSDFKNLNVKQEDKTNFDVSGKFVVNNDPRYEEFVDLFKGYVLAFKKYELFKERFESFYDEYDPSKKTVYIDENQRCCVINSLGTTLQFHQLSSGEINIASILFNVIFNTADGSIVLIDEPEISLHIAWQERFSDVILGLLKDKNAQVIVASHSPFICGGRDDLLIASEMMDEEK